MPPREGKRQRNRRWKQAVQAVRRQAAEERQAAYAALSAAEKLALLDARLGAGVGAAKQRKRLLLLAAKAAK